VYLGDEELAFLDRAARTTGASRSELIRRAIRGTYGVTYGERSIEERRRSLREAAGIWRDRDFTGAEYVDATRGDLNDRLRQLGLE
jgi:hypothetical protein